MKFNKWTLGLAAALVIGSCSAVRAQTVAPAPNTISVTSIQSLLADGVVKIGVPTTINGVTFVVSTNTAGNYVFSIAGPNGALEYTPPTTTSGAINQAGQWIGENNPTNASYYGTNDITVRLGADYLQDNGSALIDIAVEKYGLIKSEPNLFAGADLYQGTRSGAQSTAGFDAVIGYRKVIGDVAAEFSGGGGYDVWAQRGFGIANVMVEYRQNAHLGEYVALSYLYEGSVPSGEADMNGLGVKGGISYTF
jgi:hypothetical protein